MAVDNDHIAGNDEQRSRVSETAGHSAPAAAVMETGRVFFDGGGTWLGIPQ